ncbi:dynein intermediate chain 3, axonemal [Bufo bufo]|uniref:dynein intermediate chain 3, axonemal n=1 Tax=Bufo bufo TaxID=8384 RepID=UPI001ABE2BC9|nr:dynein intermediate chain 3, axonemal [Bufo bufo]XP_040263856.1 dynein intermediate chain 3, axonemal [Bufo bufo]
MSTRDSSRSPSRASRASSRGSKGKDKKTGSQKRKAKHSAKKHEDSAASTSSGHPEYIVPLVLTSKTQEIFSCRIDEDVTCENPFKLLKKEDVLSDLKNRAAVSDFSPFKSIITEYPGEELLLVFDGDFIYGQNFYLVVTEEAKESMLQPPEPITDEEEKDEDFDDFAYVPPVPRPWISLGSELEVEEEMVKESQTKIKFMISRVHREFGSRVTFSDYNASDVRDGYMECASYQDKRFNIKPKERDTGTQVVPLSQEQSTQTKWTYPRNACTQYAPREFTEEQKQEYLSSKSLKDFINSVSLRLEMALQQNEILNAFVDDWKSLCEQESTFGGKSDSHLKEYQSFTDHQFGKEKTISCISWHPALHGLVAVSLAERLSLEDRVNISSKLILKPSLILIWSLNDPIHPQLMLECPDDLYCFQFSPSDPNIIAGGCINGQVVLWDISAYYELLTAKNGVTKNTSKTTLEPKRSNEPPLVRYCAVSSIEHGHREVITDIHWLPDFFEITRAGNPYENKSGYCVQLVTCSPDCSVMFWDIRSNKLNTQAPASKKQEENPREAPFGVPDTFKHLDLVWRPFLKTSIAKTDTGGEFSPIKISLREEHHSCRMADKLQTQVKEEKSGGGIHYSSLRATSAKNTKMLEDINTSYFAGTEDGELLYTDWKMEKDGDTGRLISAKPTQRHVVHDGLVHTVQRSPFLKDFVLTVGGWNFAIWKEGVTSGPILQSCCTQQRYTAAHWSLSRPGVFFIGKEDGNVDIWDLLEKTHEPSQTQNISAAAVTYIKPWIVSAKQHLLAVADDSGTLHVLEIPWTLHHPSANEITGVLHYLDREVSHLEYYEQRKTFRAAEKRALELKDHRTKTEATPPVKSKEQLEEEISREYTAYLALENAVLTGLGIKKENEEITVKT